MHACAGKEHDMKLIIISIIVHANVLRFIRINGEGGFVHRTSLTVEMFIRRILRHQKPFPCFYYYHTPREHP